LSESFEAVASLRQTPSGLRTRRFDNHGVGHLVVPALMSAIEEDPDETD
jgi:hypothetical protein